MENRVKPPYAAGVDMSHAGDATSYAYGGGMGGGKAFRAALNGGLNLQSIPRDGGTALEKKVREQLEKYRAANPHIAHVWIDEVSRLPKQDSIDDFLEQINKQQAQSRMSRPQKTMKAIDDFTDAELIMEMLKRGYAAMKLPEDGGKPEVFR